MASFDEALGRAKDAAVTKLTSAKPTVDQIVSRLSPEAKDPPSTAAPRSWWEAANSRSDPLLNIFWYCDLPEINGVQCSWNLVEEVTLPFVEFEQVSNYRAGKNYHYPSHYNLNPLNLRLYEDSQGSATKYVDAWQSLVFDADTGLYSVASKFKKPVKVSVLNVAMATVLVLEYTGCWIQSADNIVLSSGTPQAVVRNLTLSVDALKVKIADFKASGQVNSLVDNIGKDFPASIPKLTSTFPSVFSDVSSKLFR